MSSAYREHRLWTKLQQNMWRTFTPIVLLVLTTEYQVPWQLWKKFTLNIFQQRQTNWIMAHLYWCTLYKLYSCGVWKLRYSWKYLIQHSLSTITLKLVFVLLILFRSKSQFKQLFIKHNHSDDDVWNWLNCSSTGNAQHFFFTIRQVQDFETVYLYPDKVILWNIEYNGI